jgi:hypothetical protein
VGQTGPTSLETDLEHRSEDTTGRLSDVDHVGDEGEAIELELRNVGLKENVDLRRRVIDTFLDRDRYSLEELGEFESERAKEM